jgi:hypothetical protein
VVGRSDRRPEHLAFFDELVSRAQQPRRIEHHVVFLKDPNACNEPPPLLDILGLGRDSLARNAAKTVDYLESGEVDSERWRDFKWKLLALEALQDVFDASIYRSSNITDSVFRVWYFYYEGRRLLTESVLCGLTGFYLGAAALLRPFLEFALLQNYFRRTIFKAQSYEPFDTYMRNGIAPSWNTVMVTAIPDDTFCRPIRAKVTMDLRGLSDSSAHAYHPLHSPRDMGADRPEPTLQGTFFWMQTRLVLQTVLWVYAVNFPMLFSPVDVERKFGFSPPVGYFIDPNGAAIVRRAFGDADHELLKNYAATQGEVRDLMKLYNSRPDMSPEQIMDTWDVNDGPRPSSIAEGRCTIMARMRVLREAMSWRSPRLTEKAPPPDVIDALEGLTNWVAKYKDILGR